MAIYKSSRYEKPSVCFTKLLISNTFVKISFKITSTSRTFNFLCCHIPKKSNRPERVVSEPTQCFKSSKMLNKNHHK